MKARQQPMRGNRFTKTYTKKCMYQEKKNLVGSTKYLSFITDDILYHATLYKVTTPEFKVFIHKQLKDLYFLLHLNKNDFFKQVTQSDSLKLTLESCLSTFIRKRYSTFITKSNIIEVNPKQNQAFIEYGKLFKVVLTIYYRVIIETVNQQQFQIIYNQWILDIPKIFDLMVIYGDSNPKIVKQIISKIFKFSKSYKKDFNEFLIIVQQNIIPTMIKDLQVFKINLKQLEDASYGNVHKSLFKSYMKILFSIYDYFLHLNYVYQYFPKQAQLQLSGNCLIQQKNIYVYGKFMMKITQQSILGKQLQESTKNLIEGIRQQMVKYFIKTLSILKIVIDKKIRIFYFDAIKTFVSFGKMLLVKQIKNIDKYFLTLFKILTKHLPKIFPTPQQIINIEIDKNDRNNLINFCQLQNKIRLQNQQLNHMQKIISIINHLPMFENWKNSKSLNEDIMVQKQKQPLYPFNNKLHNTYLKNYDDQPTDDHQQFPRVRLLNEWQQYCLAPKPQNKNDLSFVNDKSIQTYHSQNLSFAMENQLEGLSFQQISMIHQDRNDQMSLSSVHKNIINQFNNHSFNSLLSSLHQSKLQSSFFKKQELSFDLKQKKIGVLLQPSFIQQSHLTYNSIQ